MCVHVRYVVFTSVRVLANPLDYCCRRRGKTRASQLVSVKATLSHHLYRRVVYKHTGRAIRASASAGVLLVIPSISAGSSGRATSRLEAVSRWNRSSRLETVRRRPHLT